MKSNDEWRPSSLPDAAVASDRLLLSEVADWVNANRITIENESGAYFQLIEANFPISTNRIDWGLVKDALCYEMSLDKNRPSAESERVQRIVEAKEVVRQWFRDHGIDRRDCIIAIGDNSNVALHMTIDTLLECCHVLFLTGQHMYVIPRSAEWCLQYALEDDLYFGLARNATAKGWIG